MASTITIKQKGYRCGRCGHEWVPRKSTEGKPRVSPEMQVAILEQAASL